MIRADAVTPADIDRILGLYKEICGGAIEYVDSEEVCETIRTDNRSMYREGYRIGSNWDGHSKLRFNVEDGRVTAIMYENFDTRDRNDNNPDYVAAKAAAEKFKKAVLDL